MQIRIDPSHCPDEPAPISDVAAASKAATYGRRALENIVRTLADKRRDDRDLKRPLRSPADSSDE